MQNNKKRIDLLSQAEIEDLYERPFFSDEERILSWIRALVCYRATVSMFLRTYALKLAFTALFTKSFNFYR